MHHSAVSSNEPSKRSLHSSSGDSFTLKKFLTASAFGYQVINLSKRVSLAACAATCLLRAASRLKGRTSLRISVEAWRRSRDSEETNKVTSAIFAFVAIDNDRKPRPLNLKKSRAAPKRGNGRAAYGSSSVSQ